VQKKHAGFDFIPKSIQRVKTAVWTQSVVFWEELAATELKTGVFSFYCPWCFRNILRSRDTSRNSQNIPSLQVRYELISRNYGNKSFQISLDINNVFLRGFIKTLCVGMRILLLCKTHKVYSHINSILICHEKKIIITLILNKSNFWYHMSL